DQAATAQLLTDPLTGPPHAVVGGGSVGVKWQYQQAGIEVVAVQEPGVASKRLAISVLLDCRADGVPFTAEARDRELQMPTVVQINQPIQGNPAQDLRVCVRNAPRTAFPDPVIWFPPASAHRFTKSAQYATGFMVQPPALVHELGRCIDHFAVDVELQLPMSVVADAYRSGAGIPGQVRQRPFGKLCLTEDVVHHLQLRPG